MRHCHDKIFQNPHRGKTRLSRFDSGLPRVACRFQYPPRIEPRFNCLSNSRFLDQFILSVSSSDRTSLQLNQGLVVIWFILSFSILLGSNLASTVQHQAVWKMSRGFQYPPRIEPRFNYVRINLSLCAGRLSVSSSDRTSLQPLRLSVRIRDRRTFSILLGSNFA